MPNPNSINDGASASDYFEWTFPGAPLRIRLTLGSVAAIREYLMPGSRAEHAAAEEAGGVLLGRPTGNCVEITGFVPFTCGPQAKTLFLIAGDDQHRFRTLVDRCNRTGGAERAVGYFRSQLHEGLSLEPRDLALADDCFREPLSIYLLVELAGEDGVPTAGFFFREGGEVFGSFTLMPFPFHERLLAVSEAPPAAEPAQPAQPAPDPAVPRLAASGRWRLRVVGPAVAGALILSSAVLFFASKRPPGGVPSMPAPSVPPARGRTDLAVAGTGAGLRISWNPASETVKGARVGLLVIQDGDLKKELPLTPAMLRDSSIAYTVKSDRVDVTLELYNPDGRRTRDEVIFLPRRPGRSLRGGHRPGAPGYRADTSATSPPARAMGSAPAAAPARRSAQAPSSPPGPRHTAARDVAAATGPARSAGSSPDKPKQIAGNIGARQLNAPARRSEHIPVRIPPRPVQQVSPELSADVRRMLSRNVRVQVKVAVDAQGRVVDAQPAAEEGMLGSYLGSAAAAAARQWRFDPAQIDQKPVAGAVILEFVYKPQKIQ